MHRKSFINSLILLETHKYLACFYLSLVYLMLYFFPRTLVQSPRKYQQYNKHLSLN